MSNALARASMVYQTQHYCTREHTAHLACSRASACCRARCARRPSTTFCACAALRASQAPPERCRTSYTLTSQPSCASSSACAACMLCWLQTLMADDCACAVVHASPASPRHHHDLCALTNRSSARIQWRCEVAVIGSLRHDESMAVREWHPGNPCARGWGTASKTCRREVAPLWKQCTVIELVHAQEHCAP